MKLSPLTTVTCEVALKALLALNQVLESQLERMSELLVGRAAAPRTSIH
jgi:hypothetical protein